MATQVFLDSLAIQVQVVDLATVVTQVFLAIQVFLASVDTRATLASQVIQVSLATQVFLDSAATAATAE